MLNKIIAFNCISSFTAKPKRITAKANVSILIEVYNNKYIVFLALQNVSQFLFFIFNSVKLTQYKSTLVMKKKIELRLFLSW